LVSKSKLAAVSRLFPLVPPIVKLALSVAPVPLTRV
jgi:hypothetical protein